MTLTADKELAKYKDACRKATQRNDWEGIKGENYRDNLEARAMGDEPIQGKFPSLKVQAKEHLNEIAALRKECATLQGKHLEGSKEFQAKAARITRLQEDLDTRIQVKLNNMGYSWDGGQVVRLDTNIFDQIKTAFAEFFGRSFTDMLTAFTERVSDGLQTVSDTIFGVHTLREPRVARNGLKEHVALAADIIKNFPGISTIGGYRTEGTVGGVGSHRHGEALDCMVTHPRSPEGDKLAAWLVANAERLGVYYVIWNRKIWSVGRPYWRDYHVLPGRPNNATQRHEDHVHASFLRYPSATQMATLRQLKMQIASSGTIPGNVG